MKKDDGVPTNGFFPAYGSLENTPFGKIEPSTNLGEPGYDYNQHRQVSFGYELNHQFSESWEFQQNLRYSQLDLELRGVYALPNMLNAREVTRGLVYRDGSIDSLSVDNRFIGKWYGERTENTFLLGVDFQTHDNSGHELDDYGFDPIDVFDPEYGNFTPIDSDDFLYREITKEQLGLYAQHQLRLDDRWILLAGGRYDYVDTENANITDDILQDRQDDSLSLSAGLMYLADNGLSPYLSYTESFEVLTTVDPSTQRLYRPLEGEQIELGVKYAPYHFDGYINAAIFDLTQKNSLVTNPTTFVQTQAGEVKSRGLELEGVGYLTDNLKLVASYTYTDTTTDETGGQGTKRAGLIPRHMASTWLDYDFAGGTFEGLSIGGGVRYVGESVDSPASSDRAVSSYTLYDAMARYDFADNWRVQVNVNNLTDEEYVSGCDYYCYYGESRSVIGSLSYRW